MLEMILEDIENAVQNKSYLSALALTLSLPEICGKISVGHSEYFYSEWFDKWVYPYCYNEQEEMKKNNPDPRIIEVLEVKFDGIACYNLRNALLHEGTTKLRNIKGHEIEYFELYHNGDSEFQLCEMTGLITDNDGIKKWCFRINIICLIKNIVEGCRKFIKNNEEVVAKCNFVKLIDWDK